jgi:H+-translocating NAD(P) transhydrogenase subunit alpha
MNQLPVIVKEASDIANQAQALSDKLKDLLMDSAPVTTGVDPFIFAITIFALACFVGYYVVWKVTPALHTPLMSITNAISGIIIIGSMIAASPESFGLASVLGYIATFFAAINIFGGFVVTERMLWMFKKK